MTRPEEVIAAGRVCVAALKSLRKDAKELRKQWGDDAAAVFAKELLNDLISDLQDVIPPTVRAYNAMLRDHDAEAGAASGDIDG